MNQPKQKPRLAGAVAAAGKAPYTAAREGKDRSVNTAAADGFPQALDRRLTEGLNLLHGRLDVIHEDVRENRGDIKELRKELWDGLKEAAADRARLAERTELAALADSQQQFVGSVNRLVENATGTDRRLGALEEGQQQLVGSVNRLVEHAAGTDRRFEVMDRRLGALEEGQQQLVGAVNRLVEHAANTDRRFEVMDRRLGALEEGQRELIAKVSIALERSEGIAWTRRQVLAAVAAGITLLVVGALLQPLLERVIAALFAG